MRIIAGPCQHESLDHSFMIAQHCKEVCKEYGIQYIFKASYDKANRTSLGSKRGVGLEKTLRDFLHLKNDLGIKTLTDFHSVEDIKSLEQWSSVDVIQIPAFLCRQTDLIVEACNQVARSNAQFVNIKKGQFLAPWDVAGILSKTNTINKNQVWITERGTSFGYNTLVVDFTGIQYMLKHYDAYTIVFDVTHSVQAPGGNGAVSGGNREYVPGLAKAAAAMGVTNFFFEVHDNPNQAPSDGPNALHLNDFKPLVESLVRIANL
jgi:2-dehydro-3-deoxyphosphooctonate aldolase (KDO 8-P synthase)